MADMSDNNRIEFILKKLYHNPQNVLDYIIDDEAEEMIEEPLIVTELKFEYEGMTYFNDLFCSNEFAHFIRDNRWNGKFSSKVTMNSLRLMARMMYDSIEVHNMYVVDYENKTEEDIEKEAREYADKRREELINDSTFKENIDKRVQLIYKGRMFSYLLWKQRFSRFTTNQIKKIKNFDIQLGRSALAAVNSEISMKYEIEEKPIRDRDFLYQRLTNKEKAVEVISEIRTTFFTDNPYTDVPKTNIRFLLVSNKFLDIVEVLLNNASFYANPNLSRRALDVIIQVIGKSVEIKETNKEYHKNFIPGFKDLKREFNLLKANIILSKCIKLYNELNKKQAIWRVFDGKCKK